VIEAYPLDTPLPYHRHNCLSSNCLGYDVCLTFNSPFTALFKISTISDKFKLKLARKKELLAELASVSDTSGLCRKAASTSSAKSQSAGASGDISGKEKGKNKSTKHVSISDIRKDSGAKSLELVNQALSNSGVNVLGESTSEDEPDITHGKSFYDYAEPSRSKKRSKKRGSSILWPNDFVSYQHTQSLSPLDFESLDCRLFAIGELELCRRGGLAKEIADSRLDWLSEILGYASHYEWKAILRLHAQVLHLTSDGRLSWGDDFAFSKLVSQFIFPHLLQRKTKSPTALVDSRGKNVRNKPKNIGVKITIAYLVALMRMVIK
jgi:hypothetical protein